MKKTTFPILLTVCSAITAIILPNPFTIANLVLSVTLLGIACFSKSKNATQRMAFSALWMLILELLALALLLCQINVYQPALVWMLYVVFVMMEIFVTPRICKEQ